MLFRFWLLVARIFRSEARDEYFVVVVAMVSNRQALSQSLLARKSLSLQDRVASIRYRLKKYFHFKFAALFKSVKARAPHQRRVIEFNHLSQQGSAPLLQEAGKGPLFGTRSRVCPFNREMRVATVLFGEDGGKQQRAIFINPPEENGWLTLPLRNRSELH